MPKVPVIVNYIYRYVTLLHYFAPLSLYGNLLMTLYMRYKLMNNLKISVRLSWKYNIETNKIYKNKGEGVPGTGSAFECSCHRELDLVLISIISGNCFLQYILYVHQLTDVFISNYFFLLRLKKKTHIWKNKPNFEPTQPKCCTRNRSVPQNQPSLSQVQ